MLTATFTCQGKVVAIMKNEKKLAPGKFVKVAKNLEDVVAVGVRLLNPSDKDPQIALSIRED